MALRVSVEGRTLPRKTALASLVLQGAESALSRWARVRRFQLPKAPSRQRNHWGRGMVLVVAQWVMVKTGPWVRLRMGQSCVF